MEADIAVITDLYEHPQISWFVGDALELRLWNPETSNIA